MKQKIDLKKVKVAIFDFDDTLAIHKNSNYINDRNESEEKLSNYYLKAYLNPETFYENIEQCIASTAMKNLIDCFRNNNVKMYCVSGMKFSFHLKAKEYFVHK